MTGSDQKGIGLAARAPDLRAADSLPRSSIMLEGLAADIQAAGGEVPQDPELEGAIGTTMFDLPGSVYDTLTVLLPRQNPQMAASQALVRIKNREGGQRRPYFGCATPPPFPYHPR